MKKKKKDNSFEALNYEAPYPTLRVERFLSCSHKDRSFKRELSEENLTTKL